MESAIIGTVGGALGTVLGSIIVKIASAIGITFYIPGTETPIIVHPFNSIEFVIFTFALGGIAGVLGALHPAHSASKLSPLEAMSYV